MKIEPFGGFPHSETANGFVTLSNFVPAPEDPLQGFWSVLVKHGKLGEELAVSGNPFKQPLIMLEAGSAFYHAPCREYYGSLIEGLSDSFPQAVHYAYALPVPAILPGVE
jgi:CRISPR-associated protein Csm4